MTHPVLSLVANHRPEAIETKRSDYVRTASTWVGIIHDADSLERAIADSTFANYFAISDVVVLYSASIFVSSIVGQSSEREIIL